MDGIAPVTEPNVVWHRLEADILIGIIWSLIPSYFLLALTFCDMLIVRRVFRRKQSNSGSDGEWISHAMKAAKLTADAAKMIPVVGPFIEGGANIFCDILEPLKQSKNNKEIFKELTQSVTRVFQILQKAISGTPRAEPSDEFTQMCSDFKRFASFPFLMYRDRLIFSQFDGTASPKITLTSGMVSRYQRDIDTLRNDLMLYCTVSTHLQVQLFEIEGGSASVVPGTNDDHIPEFEEFHEFKRGDIHLHEQIKYNIRTRSSRVGVPPFKEHYASALAYGTYHRTTVRVFEGEESKEVFTFAAHLAELQPVKVLNQYGLLDLTWNTIEDLTTQYRMSRDIQDGVRHMQAKLPSFLKTEKIQYWAADFSIDIGYTELGKAQLGIYLANDNRSLNLTVKLDTGSDLFTTSNYLSSDVIIDESRLQALQTQLESRVAISPAETTLLLQNYHSVIPVAYEYVPLDLDKVLLGGVYARYLPCPTCQRYSVPYHFTSTSKEVKLVAGFSSNDYNVGDWELSTASAEIWNSLKRSDKGI
ncbi:hypothetical protein M422DRAFT_260698 [Sphaerobolus stellatus SS14]|uniref:Unplaced genomic scaffold SPHSTscaffold_99, whole genome shotgun sequence n=1 Tax=Sphaerobolus stellatus (strain SS14) TaxID=990650 RepID=A0A0C9VGZ1_SPHS4|nr:hypothetical protein M422DRAFT_260698 [Sphaerobolus stellatus SS14]